MLPRPHSAARISYQTWVVMAQIAQASLWNTTVISALGSLLIDFMSWCGITRARLICVGVPLSSMILAVSSLAKLANALCPQLTVGLGLCLSSGLFLP